MLTEYELKCLKCKSHFQLEDERVKAIIKAEIEKKF